MKVVRIKSDTVLNFGKYKNSTVKEVMDVDPAYLIWADNNLPWFHLESNLRDQAEEESEYDYYDEWDARFELSDYGDR